MDIYKEALIICNSIIYQYVQTPECGVCGAKMTIGKFIPFAPLEDIPRLVYRCTTCDFASLDYTKINQTLLTREYEKLKITCRGFENEFFDTTNEDNLIELKKYIPKPLTVVDMGSGSGGFEYYNKIHGTGNKVLSFDINKELIEFAGTKGISVYPVDITSEESIHTKLNDLGCEKVDLIYSSNSLEHLVNPKEILKIWKGIVKNGGYLYIVVPSMDWIIPGGSPFQSAHLSYFSQNNFSLLCGGLCLEVLGSNIIKKSNLAGSGSMSFLLKVN